jgi:hypothetical protein
MNIPLSKPPQLMDAYDFYRFDVESELRYHFKLMSIPLLLSFQTQMLKVVSAQ